MSKTKKSPKGKPEKWYKLVSFFSNRAQEVMKVQEEEVVLSGWVPPDKDLAVCLVPTSITHEQGLALQKLLEANFSKPVLLLSNNIQLAKLKPISNAEAKRIMGEQKHDKVIQVGKVEAGESKSTER